VNGSAPPACDVSNDLIAWSWDCSSGQKLLAVLLNPSTVTASPCFFSVGGCSSNSGSFVLPNSLIRLMMRPIDRSPQPKATYRSSISVVIKLFGQLIEIDIRHAQPAQFFVQYGFTLIRFCSRSWRLNHWRTLNVHAEFLPDQG
jgi:hypothetical protein